jgi:hypothetical protein
MNSENEKTSQLKAINAIENNICLGDKGVKITVQTKTCAHHGCENNITKFKGTGSNTLCSNHQRNLSEWGGHVYFKRVWTWYKKEICEECGFDPLTLPKLQKYDKLARRVYAMGLLDIDHITPCHDMKDKHDRNSVSNHPRNLQTLCKHCHAIKTFEEGNFLKKTK